MAYATVEDVEARYRLLTEEESGIAETLLEDAAVRIDRVADGYDEDVFQIVSCNMVIRALDKGSNAFGVGAFDTNVEEQGWNPGAVPGPMWMTRDEKAMLGRAARVRFVEA